MKRNVLTELQEKWLTALESGEYEQATDNLHSNGTYCCLGVATHVCDPDNPALEANGWDAHDYHESDIEDMWQDGEIIWEDGALAPPEVVVAINLQDPQGTFRLRAIRHGFDCLTKMNDNVGLTFPQIAALIRAEPWLVFTNFDFPEVTS